jgi:uncharacterized protein
MWTTIIAGVVLTALVFAVMAIGVLLGRKPLKGSCGGVGARGLSGCELCGGDPEQCERQRKKG